jgi:HEAT repeat protein
MVALGKVGGRDAYADLRRGTEDENDEVRGAALLGLSFLGSEEGAPILMRTLLDQEETSEIRAFAAAGLGLLDSALAVFSLNRVLLDDDEPAELRGATALALGLSHQAEAREALLQVLANRREESSIRSLAASALGRQGALDSAVPLLAAIKDRSVDVRRAAALALGAIRYRSVAQERLEKALESHRAWLSSGSLSPEARADLESSIENLRADARRDASRVRRLRSAAASWLVHTADGDADLQTRAFALVALGEMRAPEGQSLILKILGRRTHRLKPWAGLAAGVSGESAYGPLLRRAFHRKGENPSVRAAMAIGMGLLRDRTFAGDLVAVALDRGEDPDLRGYSIMAMAMMWDPRSAEALNVILDTKGNPALHRSAAIALGLTGPFSSGTRLRSLLETTNDPWVRAAATIGLGYLRDTRNAEDLAKRAGDARLPFLTRVYTVLAVGYLGDRRASPPLLSRLAWHYNYRVRLAAVDQLTSLL